MAWTSKRTKKFNVRVLRNIEEILNVRILRVLPLIYDQILSAHFLKTDDARTNRIFLLKQMTPKFHRDTVSDDTAPSGSRNKLVKFKMQTLSSFATVTILIRIPPVNWNLTGFHKWAFNPEIFVKKCFLL